MTPERFIALGMTALLMMSIPVWAATVDTPLANDPVVDSTKPPETGLTTLGFDAIDSDHNDSVTRDEFQSQGMTEALFTTIDTDHDGILTRAEIDAHGPLVKAMQ